MRSSKERKMALARLISGGDDALKEFTPIKLSILLHVEGGKGYYNGLLQRDIMVAPLVYVGYPEAIPAEYIKAAFELLEAFRHRTEEVRREADKG